MPDTMQTEDPETYEALIQRALITVYIRFTHPNGLIRTYELPFQDALNAVQTGSFPALRVTDDTTPEELVNELRKLGRQQIDLLWRNPVGKVYCSDAQMELGLGRLDD